MGSHSYICKPKEAPYIYTTIPEKIRCLAMQDPEQEAFVFYSLNKGRKAVTRQKLYQTAQLFAKNLIKLGVRKGDMIAICMNNSINMIIAIFGVLLSSGIPFFVATNLKDGSDIIVTLNNLKAICLIIDVNDSGDNWNILENIWPLKSQASNKVPSLIKLICNGTTVTEPDSSRLSLAKLLYKMPSDNIELPVVDDPEGTAVCFCTSGSSGVPKVVMVSHFSILNATKQCDISFGISNGTSYFCDRQFSWYVGFPRAYITDGCKRVFVDTRMSLSGKYIKRIVEIVAKEKCSVVYIPGYLGFDLLRNEELADLFGHVKTICTAGERLNTALLGLKDRFCKRFVDWYGLTESGSLCTFQSDQKGDYEDGIIGVPHPGVEVKVIDEKGDVVPFGESGQLCVRSTWKFNGYMGKPEMTRQVVDALGWFHTGDIGHIRPDSSIIVDGRVKDIITMQTVKYFPWEIEKDLGKYPGVKSVAAVAVPDPRLTEVICACVVPQVGAGLTVERLKKFCDDIYLEESTSAGISLKPKYFLLLEDLPLTTSGKIDRKTIGSIAKERLGFL